MVLPILRADGTNAVQSNKLIAVSSLDYYPGVRTARTGTACMNIQSHLSTLGIVLPILRADRIDMVALKQAQTRRQQTGVVVEDDSQQSDKQATLELS